MAAGPPQGGATIPIERRVTKSGEIRWRVRIRRQGAPDVYATFGRKRDAIDFERQAAPDAQRRRYVGSSSVRWTVAEMIDAFLAGGKLEELSPKYRPTREGQLRFWREALGSSTRARLTRRRSLLSVREPRSRVSPGIGTSRPCRASYRWACNEGRLSHNPVRDVERTTERAKIMRWLRDDDREKLLEACRASSDRRLYPLVLLAISTGGRRDSELMQLDWEDIELYSEPDEDGAAGLATPWEDALAESGIDQLRFHDLRHRFGTYVAHAGATAREICEALGDKTLDMALRYSRLSKTHTHAVVSRMRQSRQIGAPKVSSTTASSDSSSKPN